MCASVGRKPHPQKPPPNTSMRKIETKYMYMIVPDAKSVE